MGCAASNASASSYTPAEGGAASKPAAECPIVDTKAYLDKCYPSFHIANPVVDEACIALVKEGWNLIVNGESAAFIEAKKADSGIDPAEYFYNTFYNRLFDMAPETKPLFKNDISVQGKSLFSMITVAVSLLNKKGDDLVNALKNLAHRHNGRGIKHQHYEMVGRCLLWTLEYDLGKEFWNANGGVHPSAWLNVYSLMMTVMIPVVVEGEVHPPAAKSG